MPLSAAEALNLKKLAGMCPDQQSIWLAARTAGRHTGLHHRTIAAISQSVELANDIYMRRRDVLEAVKPEAPELTAYAADL